ncbi:hypothetical protein BO443_110148 [Burkholderia orbicola]
MAGRGVQVRDPSAAGLPRCGFMELHSWLDARNFVPPFPRRQADPIRPSERDPRHDSAGAASYADAMPGDIRTLVSLPNAPRPPH